MQFLQQYNQIIKTQKIHMGNRLNIRAKFNEMMLNITPATAKIGQNSQCPKCAMQFTSDTTYQMFNNHLQICLTTPTVVEQSQKFDQIQIYMKEQKQQQQKWTKRLVKINQQIFSLSFYEIKLKGFPEKLAWFYENMEKHRIKWHQGSQTIVFQPNHVVRDSIQTFLNIDLHRQLKMSVVDDKVSDAGGILRQWTSMVLKSLIVDYNLLIPTQTDHSVYQINPTAVTNQNRKLFSFLGAVIGKALFEKITVDIYFDHTLLKQLLGQKVQLEDMKSFNSNYYNSWKKILVDQNPQQLGLNFTILKNGKIHQLIENGNNIHVNKTNKDQFIRKCIEFYCISPFQQAIQQIITSFNSVIPQSLVNIFTPNQFEEIFNGVTILNLKDWKQGTQYSQGYSQKHKVIAWFWNTLSKMSQQDLKVLLKFVTGCRTLPIFGFKKLETNRGKKSAFTIQPIKYDKKNPLPKSQTCFNRLLLPLYPSQKQLTKNLQQLVKIEFEGFWGLQ